MPIIMPGKRFQDTSQGQFTEDWESGDFSNSSGDFAGGWQGDLSAFVVTTESIFGTYSVKGDGSGSSASMIFNGLDLGDQITSCWMQRSGTNSQEVILHGRAVDVNTHYSLR